MFDKNALANKRCLVTGASKGIGKSIALTLSALGAEIIVHFNNDEQAARSVLESLPGENHLLVQANLAEKNGVQHLFDQISDFPLHVLVNNAGIYIENSFEQMNLDEWLSVWEKTIALNLSAPAHLSYMLSKHMIESGGGCIINITSRGAFRGEPDALAYGASKAGLNSFGQSLAKALALKNIFIFTVAPGFVDTDMAKDALDGLRGNEIRAQSPLNRVAKPEEIANLVAYLAAYAPAYMTGSIIDINGASYLRT